VDQLKIQLSVEFKIKNMGKAKRIWRMDIDRDIKTKKLWLTQTKYIKSILARFNMGNAKPASLPLATHFKLSHAQYPTTAKEKGLMSKVPYDKAVGSLMYLMVCTRPKISLAMSKVSRYMSNPGKVH
jgi:hypothetical protein